MQSKVRVQEEKRRLVKSESFSLEFNEGRKTSPFCPIIVAWSSYGPTRFSLF